MTSQGGGEAGAAIKARRRRGLPGRREHRVAMAVLPRLLPLLALLLSASSAAHLATSAHSSCPGPLAHTLQKTYILGSDWGPFCGLSSPRTRTRRPAHPLPWRELARVLSFVFPSCSPRSGAQNRSTGDPQSSGVPHRLRTRQQSAPETRLASSSVLSRGRPPTPTRTKGQRPSRAPSHSGPYPRAGRKPSPEPPVMTPESLCACDLRHRCSAQGSWLEGTATWWRRNT